MKKYEKLIEAQKKYIIPTTAPEIMLVKGEGSYVWDSNDVKYLDFSMGISVSNLGHCHPSVTAAIRRQAKKFVHCSNLYMNENQPKLAKKLIKKGFDGKVFFANSGSEANEGMIKLARKWGNANGGKNEIIAMDDSFHGRTLAALAATGRSKYREGFSPDMPGFNFVPFNDINALKSAINEKTAAVMLEPVQGEGGVIPATDEYLKQVRALCDEKNILLLFDEVQCGMGRTGHFYAYQSYGVEPDVLSLAKALGNGFPIGAFIAKRKYADVLGIGTHNSTFGGSPLACAAACAVIDAIDKEDMLENCVKQGDYIKKSLNALKEKHKSISDVRGKGLMIGVVLDFPAKDILGHLKDSGLLALSAGEKVLRLMPPLNVTNAEIDSAVRIIDRVLTDLHK